MHVSLSLSIYIYIYTYTCIPWARLRTPRRAGQATAWGEIAGKKGREEFEYKYVCIYIYIHTYTYVCIYTKYMHTYYNIIVCYIISRREKRIL